MRLLIVTHYWRPHRGGIETVAREQGQRLAARGHQVSVLTSRLAGDAALERDGGLTVHRVAASDLLGRRGIPYPIFSPRLLPLLDRLVPQQDVLLLHGHTYLGSVAAALAARRHRRPAALLQHSPFIRYRLPWSVIERGADLLLGRATLRSATRLFAVSRHTAGYVSALAPRRRVEVLPPGVDTQRFQPVTSDAERRRVRGRLGLPEDAFVVLTIRRLVYRNGLDTLIAAASRWRGHPEILTLIGGSGPERPSLEGQIRRYGLEGVRLLGPIADQSLADVYRAADLFILPTRTGEGFGLVLLEAFASGLPVVATRAGAPEEVVAEGRTGLLTPPAAPEELAAAVLALREQPALRRAMGDAARATAEALDWERCVDRLERRLLAIAGRACVDRS